MRGNPGKPGTPFAVFWAVKATSRGKVQTCAPKGAGRNVKMGFELREKQDRFVVHRYDQPFYTPLGTEIGSRFRELAQEIACDLEQFGDDPASAISMFLLQASFLDIGPHFSKAGLIDILNAAFLDEQRLMQDLEEHPALEAAMIGPRLDARDWKRSLQSFNRRQLMATLVVSENMGSVRLGRALLAEEIAPYPSAHSLCARFLRSEKEFDKNGVPVLAFGRPDTSWYRSPQEDEVFCGRCESRAGKIAARDYSRNCGVVRVLEKVVRFARFPLE